MPNTKKTSKKKPKSKNIISKIKDTIIKKKKPVKHKPYSYEGGDFYDELHHKWVKGWNK